MMKHLKTWITILLLVGLIGGYSAYAMLQPGPAVDAVAVTSGVIRGYVEERARTTLPRVYRLTMPMDGRVEPITIEPGSAVVAGAVVARLDSSDLDAAVTIAQAELDQAEAELAVLKDDAIAKTALNEAKRWIATIDALGASAEEVIKANQDHAAFAAWWQEAEQKLKKQGAVADEQYRRAKTASSEAAVDLAVSQLNRDVVLAIKQIFELGPKYVTDYLHVKTLEAAVLISQRNGAAAKLEQAKRARARADIKAPVGGVVLTREVENERVLPAGSELLSIGDTGTLQVRADLLSQDATRIRAGDAVDVFGAAIGDIVLNGHVIRVHPQAFTKVSSLGVQQQRVAVDIAFADSELDRLKATGTGLGVDFRVQVRIYTDEAANALIVPRMALFRADEGRPERVGSDGGSGDADHGGWQVFTVVAGKAVATPVRIGLGNLLRVQITSGLKSGDLVIVAPPKDLVGGDKVTARGVPLES